MTHIETIEMQRRIDELRGDVEEAGRTRGQGGGIEKVLNIYITPHTHSPNFSNSQGFLCKP